LAPSSDIQVRICVPIVVIKIDIILS